MRWPLRNDKGEEVHIELKPQLSCNDFIVLVEAAVRGRGIALLPSIATQEELRRGQLVPVLPQWQSPEGIVHCIYPSRRGMMPAVRTLLDFLSQRLPPTYQRLEKQGATAPAAQ